MHEVPPNIFIKRHPASIDPQRSTIPLRIFFCHSFAKLFLALICWEVMQKKKIVKVLNGL